MVPLPEQEDCTSFPESVRTESFESIQSSGDTYVAQSHSPRVKLLSKLGLPISKESSSEDLKEMKDKTHCTCIIFDWDDTLFCTTHFRSSKPLPSTEMQKLDEAAAKILTKAINLGTTKIVTNAAGGWVEETAQAHLPQVFALLGNIEIISARDQFENKYPNDPVTWKVEAFCAIKQNSKVVANLTAIGDSEAEMVAIREMAKLYDISFFKAVKMKATPSCQELRKELKLLSDKLENIVHGARNFSISLHSRPV